MQYSSNFISWLSNNISFCDKLNTEEYNTLNELYNEVEKCEEIIKKIFDMSFNHNKSDIYYSSDLEKSQNNLSNSKSRLNKYLENLTNKYSIISNNEDVRKLK